MGASKLAYSLHKHIRLQGIGVLCVTCSLLLPPTETLPYLFQILFVLDSGLAPQIIHLIHAALSGTPPTKGEEPSLEVDSRSSRSSRKKAEEIGKAREESKVSVVGT